MSMLSPEYLRERGLEVTECVQEAGQMVITFPAAYHAGFNEGYNVAESTNFASRRWPAIARGCRPCECEAGRVHIRLDDVAEAIETGDLSKVVKRSSASSDDDASSEHDAASSSSDDFEVVVRAAKSPPSTPVRPSAAAPRVVTPATTPRGTLNTPRGGTKRKRRGGVVGRKKRTSRCGECDGCRAPECGTCKYCLDRPKRGGRNALKKPCVERRCVRVADSHN
mmetsp:Transcript_15736/g.63371  ORF Transcript_15736/g.63371 Transcript_15736/m.63371 type:complete len:224 (+) Transcript_15736:898-1569(+)